MVIWKLEVRSLMLEAISTIPVLASPKVRVCIAVVAMVAALLNIRLPELLALPVVPEIKNLELEVAVPPRLKSSVILRGETTPKFLCQVESAKEAESVQAGMPPDTERT